MQKFNKLGLLQKLDNLLGDGRLEMAAEATIPIQDWKTESGDVYEIKLVATLKTKNDEGTGK